MKIEKIKGVCPRFDDSVGPHEIVTLGLNIDGTLVNFGTFYFGPRMDEDHGKLFEKFEKFIDECVNRFSA